MLRIKQAERSTGGESVLKAEEVIDEKDHKSMGEQRESRFLHLQMRKGTSKR